MFEPEIAKLAAINRSQENLDDIRKSIDNLINCDTDLIQAEADLINLFHAKITESCGNSFVMISMEPIFSLIPRMRNFIYANVEGERTIRVNFHEKIYTAIAENDGDSAHAAMKEMIEHTNETYINKLQKYNTE